MHSSVCGVDSQKWDPESSCVSNLGSSWKILLRKGYAILSSHQPCVRVPFSHGLTYGVGLSRVSVTSQFMSFTHFPVGLFVVFFRISRNSLYIMEINPYSVIPVTIIFLSSWSFSFGLCMGKKTTISKRILFL